MSIANTLEKAVLGKLLGGTGTLLHEIIGGVDPGTADAALTLVQDEVAKLDGGEQSGTEKHAAAKAAVVAALEAAGKQVADYILNILIVIAVGQLRAAVSKAS